MVVLNKLYPREVVGVFNECVVAVFGMHASFQLGPLAVQYE